MDIILEGVKMSDATYYTYIDCLYVEWFKLWAQGNLKTMSYGSRRLSRDFTQSDERIL